MKIEKGLGISDFYSKDSLISALNDTINITSKSLKGFASDDIAGRDKLVMMARRIRNKDIESTFPLELIELENNLNVEAREDRKKMREFIYI